MKRSVYTREKAGRVRELRSSSDRAERVLWEYLRNTTINGFSFARQVKLGPYVLDFYCAPAKLAIELDAGQHAVTAGTVRNSARTRYLNKKRIAVIRFANDELTKNFRGVCEAIAHALPENPTRSETRSAAAPAGVV
jgi:very-short-patch-repair endonuclease